MAAGHLHAAGSCHDIPQHHSYFCDCRSVAEQLALRAKVNKHYKSIATLWEEYHHEKGLRDTRVLVPGPRDIQFSKAADFLLWVMLHPTNREKMRSLSALMKVGLVCISLAGQVCSVQRRHLTGLPHPMPS